MAPKMPMSSTPAPGTLYGKRDCEDVTKLRIRGGGREETIWDYQADPVQSHSPYKGRQKGQSHRQKVI